MLGYAGPEGNGAHDNPDNDLIPGRDLAGAEAQNPWGYDQPRPEHCAEPFLPLLELP